MPLPWKKVKSTRISQLVNDHLNISQKRRDGSSLVVETGFPTSLVDLFIKNREKLKKPSKKKRQTTSITPLSDDFNDSVITGSPISSPAPPPSPMISPLITVSPLRKNPSISPSPSEVVNKNPVLGLIDEGTLVSVVGDRGVDANAVLFVVLKMFLVVVLALGTKRLTVGITLSAFFLFFLEYVGKHVYALLKPYSKAKGVLMPIVQSFWEFLKFKEVKLDEKNISGSRFHLDQEIQAVESNRYPLDEIRPENEIMDDASCSKGGFEYQDILYADVLLEKEESKRKSRRSKIKSKMKKLVPRKLRSSNKEHEIVRKDHSVFLSDEQQVDDQWDTESASELSSVSSGRYKEEDNMNVIRAFVRSSDDFEEDNMNATKNEEIKEDGLTWRYLILCVIVLAGLIGGRVFALLLTLSWCLVLKLGEKLPMMIKSFKDDESG
ncbi:hypothetical protein DH2020_017678 [Rehmannia glutinosa]|uniref:Ethylene-responsive nuclear family protein n=1 Tax=Rehmannia glutinosa TaxID=99300 RepID=A0ABR0WT91_REHGL